MFTRCSEPLAVLRKRNASVHQTVLGGEKPTPNSQVNGGPNEPHSACSTTDQGALKRGH